MRKIFQIIIPADKQTEDQSKNILEDQPENILENYNGVSALGIQAYPGTKFYLSQDKKGNSDKSFPIIIGPTGIYQVDLKEYGTISYLSLDEEEIKQDIIIDILYNNKIDQEA